MPTVNIESGIHSGVRLAIEDEPEIIALIAYLQRLGTDIQAKEITGR